MSRGLPARVLPSRLFRGVPYLRFGERERNVILLVECQGSVERRPFLALEALDELGGSRRKELREMLVGQLLVQKASENEQSAPLVVAFGKFLPEDDFPFSALGAYDAAACRFGETDGKYLFGDLAGIDADGAHEGFRGELVPLDLHERLFPTAGQFHVRHAHFSDGFIDGHSLVGRHECFPGTFDVFPLEKGGDDGRTGRRSSDAQLLHRLAHLLVCQLLAATLHGREQGGLRV